MKRIKSYIGRSVAAAIAIVLLIIVALDGIAEFVDQLNRLQAQYTLVEALIYTAFTLPSTLYSYLPLACLVGCLLGLGALASSNELVIVRAAGVTMTQIIWAVMRPVLLYILVGLSLGEFVTPMTDQYAESRKAMALGHRSAMLGQRGIWNREGDQFMHFSAVMPGGKLYGITRFEFDENAQLVSTTYAESASFQDGVWREENVVSSTLTDDRIEPAQFAARVWQAEISPALLDILALPPANLAMQRLYTYARYLERQGQEANDYRLAFWQKALQPLATASLVMIAISFIFGPLREVTAGFRVFSGVIVGIGFQTTQELLGPSSLIYGFPPVIAVLLPIMLSALVGIYLLRRSV